MVDWALAQRVAAGALILKPAPASYRSSDLQDQFDELTARAESLVSEATGLHSAHGSARAKVTDRPGWASANVRSIERLVGPALMELQRKRGAKLSGPSLVVGRAVAGTQLGLMLAYMATRVLGQYDLLINDEAPEDQDLVSYVGPNIVAVEAQYDFAPSQFRLWLALHEVTHRLQFTAVPWLRDHFVGQVSELLGPLSGDPAGFADMVRRVADDVRNGRNPAREGGVVGMLATPEQRLALSRISGMMSLLEGHGDVTMDRAGAAAVPGADRFSQVLRERRQQVRGPARLLQQVLGLEAKLRQYQEGEEFIRAVEQAGATVMPLPPYSPDLTPIEKMFSKLKESLRSAAARTTDGLTEAIGSGLRRVSAQDIKGWFGSCGLVPKTKARSQDQRRRLPCGVRSLGLCATQA